MEPPEIYTWEEETPRRPGGVRYTSSAPQRGTAAHLRQWNIKKRKSLLTKQQLKFINKVIHHPSMKHTPKFDPELKRLAAITNLYSTPSAADFPRDINVEEASHAATTDASIELSPDQLDTTARTNPVVLPFGKPLSMVSSDGAMLDMLTIGPSNVQLCLADDGMVRVRSVAHKDHYLVMDPAGVSCFGAYEKALQFEVIVTPTGPIYEEESTGHALRIKYQDQTTLIIGRKTNAADTQSRFLLEPSPHPPASSDVSTGREGSISVSANETSDGKNKKKRNKNKKTPKKIVDTQKNTSQTTLTQTDKDTALQLAVIGLNRFEQVALASEAQIQRLKCALRIGLVLLVITWGYFWTVLIALALIQFLIMRFMKHRLNVRVPNVVTILLYLESFVSGPGIVEVHDP